MPVPSLPRPRVLIMPMVSSIYAVPLVILYPVFTVWLGIGSESKIAFAAIYGFLPTMLATAAGIQTIDPQLLLAARSMGASRLRVMWDVLVPSALPELLNGVRTALALSFVLLVSAELIVARSGLGYMIGFLGSGGTYDGMFAAVLTVAFLGFLADRIYQRLMSRVLQWRE